MRVETVQIADLVGDAENARTHDAGNLAAIQASLDAHGQVEPLVVQRGGWVIAGNGRLAAMRALGWTEAQVVLLDVSDQEARALSIRLNRSGELAGWDLPLLAEQLQQLEQAEAATLPELGWDAKQWDELLSGLGSPDAAVPGLDDQGVAPPSGSYALVVEFRSEAELQAAYEDLAPRYPSLRALKL